MMIDELWNKKRFVLCGFDQEEFQLIKKKYIEEYDGIVIDIRNNIDNNDVDYLICNYSIGYKQRLSNIEYQKLRTPFWLWLSVKDKWNYSLDWHPFFRPNGNFTYNLLFGIHLYLINYSMTYHGLENTKSPKYIRKINDIGILTSFITTQMGGNINIDKFYNKDENIRNRTKLALICDINLNNEDNYLNKEIMNEIKIKEQEGYRIITMNWLFDCYEEGRILNYRNYILNMKDYEANFENFKKNKLLDNQLDYVFKIIISHQTYFKYKDNSIKIINQFSEKVAIGRPSKEIIRLIQENENEIDKMILTIVFDDFIEEQDFWYDLFHVLSENVLFNIKLFSNEKKDQIQRFIQRIRIMNEPEEFFLSVEVQSKIDNLGSKVGCSIPSFVNEIITSKTEILATVLKSTDFQNATDLNSFVEYANDDSLDIIQYNMIKAVKKFNNIENDFLSEKIN